MRVPQASRMLALGLLLLAMTPIRARDDCDAPVADWQPRSAVHALAQRNRWQIDRLKVDDGCYEIKGRDADGRRFRARLDPATLDVVSMKQEHHARGREHPEEHR
ncbi:PepSY domain-containing protein [Dokdonella fugitiva]|uniref:PepSY domain-containing protein n=1 Tax=Dokdonella fugitiva TaxID=328517 RepID=A0A4R2HX09_9GAMM|nr:PepSY domain-containing protein [Dokdonella fugitiva]TCO36113.1 hypothetical protein EV148_11435 [Dokdonella fugitiva]